MRAAVQFSYELKDEDAAHTTHFGKCNFCTADVQQGACELQSTSRELKDEEASRSKALQQLKQKLQEELWTIRGAVDTVKLQVCECSH